MNDNEAINAAYVAQLGTLFSSIFNNSTGEGGLPYFKIEFARSYGRLKLARDAALAIINAPRGKEQNDNL